MPFDSIQIFRKTYDADGEPLPDSKPITSEVPQMRELRGVTLA